MILNIIIYIHFLLNVSQFNHNFTDKYFINNIINLIINNFCFILRLNNNTSINASFDGGKSRPINVLINILN